MMQRAKQPTFLVEIVTVLSTLLHSKINPLADDDRIKFNFIMKTSVRCAKLHVTGRARKSDPLSTCTKDDGAIKTYFTSVLLKACEGYIPLITSWLY